MTNKVIDTSDLSNFDAALKSFKAPKVGKNPVPYVLFGCWKFSYSGSENGTYDMAVPYRLHCHCLHADPPAIDKLERYIEKGYVVLDYWLPKKGEEPPKGEDVVTESGWIANLRYGDSVDPYARIRAWADRHIRGNKIKTEEQETITALQKELAELKAKENGSKTSKRTKKSVLPEPSAEKPEQTSGL